VSKAVWFIAPVLGLAAMVVPVLVWPPANPYDAPLFPSLRNAQEYLGLGQLALFFVTGAGLGLLNDRFPWRLGFTTVSLLPVAVLLEVRVDPNSHTLWPVEVAFYAAYGALVAAGALTSRRLHRERRESGAVSKRND
jgi:hypothetical protein